MKRILNLRCTRNIVPITLTDNGTHYKATFKYFEEALQNVKALEGAKWDPDLSAWIIPKSERNEYCLNQFENRFDPRYDSPASSFLPPPLGLKKHQENGFNEALSRQRIILAHDPGTGKTRTSLEVANAVGGLTWVFAPKNVAINTWPNELQKWNLGLNYWDGSKRDRTIKFFSIDKMAWAVQNIPIQYWPDHLIIDECHKFRNPTSQRTQALFLLASFVRSKGGTILLLSGTAQPKDPSDWWTYCEVCQPGYLRESDKGKLARRLGVYETKVGKAGQQYPQFVEWRPGEISLMKQRLGNIVHIARKKDCLDLPEKQFIREELECDDIHLQATRMVIDASNRSPLEQLRQLSDGFDYTNGTEFESPKETWLKDFLEEYPYSRIILYAAYHKSIDKLTRLVRDLDWHFFKLDGRGFDSSFPCLNWTKTFTDQNDPRRIAYIAHPESGGIGLNLQPTPYIVFYSNDFKWDNRIQAIDRAHRLGMGDSLTVIDLLWLPTDYYVLDNLEVKGDLNEVVTGELKEFVNRPKKTFKGVEI